MGAQSTGYIIAGFVIGIRAHHIGSVEMIEVVLSHGTDPATRGLAQAIIDPQTDGIACLTKRLLTHSSE